LPVCVYLMAGPRSYTRQDVVEVHLPAIPAAVEELLLALRAGGVRLASPGEFTRRALMSGRISMIQAEAIGALIRAGTADEARAWVRIAGTSSRHAPAGLREEIDELLARLELGLDFSQEDVCLMPREQLAERIASLILRLSAANRSQGTDARGLAWGCMPRVVLTGPTGAGKSTLLNALVGREAALVSPAGHTTRDPVEVLHEVEQGLSVLLSDTAGLDSREASPPQALSAWSFTDQAARSADILLIVLDRTNPAGAALEELKQLLGSVNPATACLIWNKNDLVENRPPTAWEVLTEATLRSCIRTQDIDSIVVAAKSGAGFDRLVGYMAHRARQLQARLAAVWSQGLSAQRAGYETAQAALERAQQALRQGLGEDAIAVELREASHALSDAQGVLLRHDGLTEALLDRIFSRFCIGK